MMIKLTQDQSLAKLGRSKSRAVNFLLYLFIRRRLSTQGKITEQQYNDNVTTPVFFNLFQVAEPLKNF